MYELAWKMSRDNNDLLWWAIIGHTEQLLMLKSEVDKYIIGTGNLRDHVSRLNISSSATDQGAEAARSIGSITIFTISRMQICRAVVAIIKRPKGGVLSLLLQPILKLIV